MVQDQAPHIVPDAVGPLESGGPGRHLLFPGPQLLGFGVVLQVPEEPQREGVPGPSGFTHEDEALGAAQVPEVPVLHAPLFEEPGSSAR